MGKWHKSFHCVTKVSSRYLPSSLVLEPNHVLVSPCLPDIPSKALLWIRETPLTLRSYVGFLEYTQTSDKGSFIN